MTIIPGLIVPAPEPLRTRYGLFTAASGPLDLPPHGEGGGVRYVPGTCGTAYAVGVTCYDDEESSAPEKPHDTDNAEVQTGVFAVLSTLNCGAPGYTWEEYQAKVQRRLESTEQAAVEAALWSGLDLDGNDLGILTLDGQAQDVDPGYDPGLITDVVGALERYAYTEQQYGYTAYIHAPVEVAAFAAEAGMAIRDGSRIITPLGSVWVFGAYGSGSVIITGQTTVWRAPEIQVYDAFDRTTNEVLLVAERTYAVGFDCLAGRAEFDPLEVVS